MSDQNPQIWKIDEMYKCVLRFGDLGTGKEHRKVLVGDSADARTATFSFFGSIHHNWPSWHEVGIKTEDGRVRTFYSTTQTLNGCRVYLFLWNELIENLWLEQNERQKLGAWFEAKISAEPLTSIAMMELVVELTGSKYPVRTCPYGARANLKQFQIEIRKLNLSALRQLNNLTIVDGSLNAAELVKGL